MQYIILLAGYFIRLVAKTRICCLPSAGCFTTFAAVKDPKDIEQIEQHGLTVEAVDAQLKLFRQGAQPISLDRPATLDDGIVSIDRAEAARLASMFDQRKSGINAAKFVPASGAATRMFQHLHNTKGAEEQVAQVVRNFHKLPFALVLTARHDEAGIVKFLLEEYANKPKALIPFHGRLTPVHEHAAEALEYSNGNLHFTVSPEHQGSIQALAAGIHDIKASFSQQYPSTDTIAARKGGRPFRDNKRRLIFRPGGHGALLENLNDMEEDLVFIKNIDNVQPEHNRADTLLYKKALAGYLLEWLESNKPDKPVRVCGMVRNEGEPGGGPFWVADGSLQIVEKAQVAPEQQRIMEGATHFNPVDLVCWLKDEKGQSFDLTEYGDDSTFYISEKTHESQVLKALELPGLWNGAMAKWHTLFVEVPITTFTPVKTVNDLLRPEHQPA